MRTLLWTSALTLGVSALVPAQRPATFSRAAGTTSTPQAGTGSGSVADERPSVAFWQAIGDTTLERLIGEAIRGNQDMRVADARVQAARAARLSSTLDLTPSITAAGGYTRQRLATAMAPGAIGSLPDQGLWDAGLRLSWDVDVFGRTRRTMQGHGELVGAASEDRREVQVVLATEVADAYFALRGAQDRLAVARRNAENQGGTLDITLQRLEAGRGTALDSERAQALLSATLADIPALEASIATARYTLAVLTARSPDALLAELEAPATPVVLPELLSVASVDSFVRRRPDVRSAERQVAARAAFVGAARAEYLPRLAIGGVAGYTGSSFERLGNSGTPRYAIGPVVSLPVLDFARVRAGVDAARAGEAEAKARYNQTILRASAEIDLSIIRYRRARERLRLLDDAAGASERAAELARLRFTEGASDFLQVLDAERTLLEAQDRRALGRIEATTALVAVHRAMGGAWPLRTGGPR